MKELEFNVTNKWSGNLGMGTQSASKFSRDFELVNSRKSSENGGNLPAGDAVKGWNPEELLVAALSSCHKLTYLYLCAQNGVNVQSYEDNAAGVLLVEDGGGHFQEVTLRPVIEISADSDTEKAQALHWEAEKHCFVTKSVNFEVFVEADIRTIPH